MSDEGLHQRVKQRAYMLWEQEGQPDGRAEEHWRRAEAEIAGTHGSLEEAPPGTPGAGEHVCPACQGSGRRGRRRCAQCGGTGRLVEVPEP